ncbi:hypothetical protein SmJEL517_g03418 [Synchytrium microbalum]|uniref:Protein HGH1 homolog n=1 Tax=Synchytrium microbalum TaxID=1806994 RepID=A0A507C6U4_9FUNG|nr:uncharacterized protein SmJEL517_g03418 [Synchytrium microbalum]TPX33774.1 hypothetical protein SmJEL517_g03418 [Synchytrium microbalum]
MEAQVQELFGFLKDDRADVRQLAASNVAGLTGTAEFNSVFKKNPRAIRDLMSLISDEAMVAHEAINALTNLSADLDILAIMASSGTDFNNFLYMLLVIIISPNNMLTDAGCMLLNNISKSTTVITALLPSMNENKNVTGATTTGPVTKRASMLDNLLDLFVKGVNKSYNPKAEYHFLGGVFANISGSARGSAFFLEDSTVDSTPRLSRLIPFTEHANLIRRGGVDSTLRNICLAVANDKSLASSRLEMFTKCVVLGAILLPLAGPEEYGEEDMDGMPAEIQFLEDTKKREADPKLRLILVEAILALCSIRGGRVLLRENKVYPVLKHLHIWEKDTLVLERIESAVDLLMRDEKAEIIEVDDTSKSREETSSTQTVEEDEEDDVIEELL